MSKGPQISPTAIRRLIEMRVQHEQGMSYAAKESKWQQSHRQKLKTHFWERLSALRRHCSACRAWIANLQRSGSPKGLDILTLVAFEWDMNPQDIKTRSNSRYYVEPRQVASYLMYQMMHISFPQIGRDLGGFEHTTIMSGVRTIKRRMEADSELRERVESVKRRLR